MRLFIYGSLMMPQVRKNLLSKDLEVSPGILDGYEKKADQSGYLFIDEKEGQATNGGILYIGKEEQEILDAWEDVPVYELIPVKVRCEDKIQLAFTYTRKNADGKPVPPDTYALKTEAEVVDEVKRFLRKYDLHHYDKNKRCCRR